MTRLLSWPARQPIATLIIAAVLSLAAIAAARHVHNDASIQRLFPANDPAASALTHIMNNYAAVEQVQVMVSLPDDPAAAPPDTQRLLSFAQRLADGIHHSSSAALVGEIRWKTDEGTKEFFQNVVAPNGMYYLSDTAMAAALNRLSRDAMARQIRHDEDVIAAPGPMAGALSKVLLQDPLDLHEFLMDQLGPAAAMGGTDADLSRDGRSLLIQIAGTRPISDLAYCHAITDLVNQQTSAANRDALRIDISGGYAIAAASETGIRHDMIESVTGSVVLMGLLFMLAYRRPVELFIAAMIPVGLGILWGFGIYGALGLELTPLTAVIGAILAGMGIDYSVQFLSRYEILRDGGCAAADAAQRTNVGLAGAVLGAWATSVIGFLAIGTSSLPAMRDFAILGSLGLAGAFVAALSVLPALLVTATAVASKFGWKSRWAKSRLRVNVGPLMKQLADRPTRSLGTAGAILAAAVVILAWPGERFPLESDLSVMHPRPNPALDAEATISRRMGQSYGSLMICLTAGSSRDLVVLAHDVSHRLDTDVVRKTGVTGSMGLATLLPDPNLAPVRQAATGSAMADRVIADFRSVVADSDFDPKAFVAYEQFLSTLLTASRPPGVEDLLRYPSLAQLILPRSATPGASGVNESVMLLLLNDPLEERSRRDAAVSAVREALSGLTPAGGARGATLTGLAVAGHDAELLIGHDLPRLVWLAVIAVGLYLWAHLRNFRDAMLTLAPTVFGLAVLLAVLRLMGQRLNMVNLVSLPLLIGIDVDYGIFLVSVSRGLRDSAGTDAWARGMSAAMHAVIVCAMSAALGFGSLVTCGVPAIRSLGVAAGLGAAVCLLGAMLAMPALLWLSGKQKAPTARSAQGAA